jgi:isopentenyl phosphate kinase
MTTFLKLGGSLITEKGHPETPRLNELRRLANEIAGALSENPGLQVVLGHGAGSFGHPVAAHFGTQHGAHDRQDWRGFQQVWHVESRLNRLVIDALVDAGLPAMAFPPSASVICQDGDIQEVSLEPIRLALQAGLLPVVFGDVAFDHINGATIVSTEKVFAALAEGLLPSRVLLAGIEEGVLADFPGSGKPMPSLTERDLEAIQLGGASAPDVTGGMLDKVLMALDMARRHPPMEIRIFSGLIPGNVQTALLGGTPGTLIRSAHRFSSEY